MRRIGRHTWSQNTVLEVEVSRYGCLVVSIAIKNQEPLFAPTFLRIFVKVLDTFEVQLVISPSIIAYSDFSGSRDASLVLCRLMKPTIEDDRWRDCLPFALVTSIVITHFRLPACFILGRPFLPEVVITLEVTLEMTPIWKLVSSELKMSPSRTSYLAIVSPTALDHKSINFRSSTSVLRTSGIRERWAESIDHNRRAWLRCLRHQRYAQGSRHHKPCTSREYRERCA